MDEVALIQEAKKGDVNAYNRLVLHYQQAAYNVAYRIMGEPQAAEDATQEAFISAYKALNRFRGGSFKSWLMRKTTNACYDLRSSNRFWNLCRRLNTVCKHCPMTSVLRPFSAM
jgi:RNA polymerase sigma-70 factor (ECF subfamily)